MLISELLRQLSYGELSNLSLSNSGDGTILDARVPQLAIYANDGLAQLFSKFQLLQKGLIIELQAGRTIYPLTAEHAYTVDPTEYIIDTVADPFLGDVAKILEVWDEDAEPIRINDKEDQWSVFTPQPHVLQVPYPTAGEPLNIVYQARHPVLVTTGVVATITAQEIDIPFYLEGALRSWIAYRVFSNMNGQDNKIAGQEHFGMYQGICASVEAQDLVNQTVSTTNSRFDDRGFV